MTARWLVAPVVSVLVAGCSAAPEAGGKPDRIAESPRDSGTREAKNLQPRKVPEPEEDVFRKGDTPEETRYMEAGRPFIMAVAKKDAAAVYVCLSSHAKAQMQVMQFKTPMDEAEQVKLAKEVFNDVSAEKFAELFGEVVKRYGEPATVRLLYCFQTDPQVLAGAGEPIDTMFAIGGMPPSVPTAIRRASLRGQVTVRWTPGELAKEAASSGRTQAEILNDEDQPYFNIKFVLVEENGQLKVGYFEFMPPSIMD